MAASAVKRKRVSKKNKKNWRKHSDIKQIEEFLDEERLIARTGGHFDDKPDDKLFFIDDDTKTQPEKASRHVDIKNLKLRCHHHLEPDLKIKPVVQPKTVKRKAQVKRFPKQNTVSKVRLEAQRKRKAALENKDAALKKKAQTPVAEFDLWSTGAKTECQSKVKRPKTLQVKPTDLPAVEVCHPGASYNPENNDHKDLMIKAAAVFLEQEETTNRFLRKMEKPKDLATEESRLQEMSEGLFNEENEVSDEDQDGEESDDVASGPTNRPKTKQQKRKQRERNLKERQVQQLKLKKSRFSQLYRLKSLKREIKEKEIVEQARKEILERRKAERKTKRLNYVKFEEPDAEVTLPENLAGSFRDMKVEGNLLSDRYKSLQKRNIVEPRQRATRKRKYKLKYVTKRSAVDADDKA